MDIRVSGHQIDTGEALQQQVDEYRVPLIEAAFHLEEKLILSPYSELGGWQKDVAMQADELRVRIEKHSAKAQEYQGLLQEMQVLQGHPGVEATGDHRQPERRDGGSAPAAQPPGGGTNPSCSSIPRRIRNASF